MNRLVPYPTPIKPPGSPKWKTLKILAFVEDIDHAVENVEGMRRGDRDTWQR